MIPVIMEQLRGLNTDLRQGRLTPGTAQQLQ
jgi:hypothetical protein